ncbi:ABC transporter permease [Egibacter rhizosphaerae]|uniref:ABC transporter permease n=1 Tax=Egibacter rhizosphaerae TaxID=1670831 RepID=A0A411YJK6_9ACTN|nr:ABC transporter permease [Egibacter rhizosphaerae]QBI21322.1 ABC transporter permease [Egibacter rhizosphaerae]
MSGGRPGANLVVGASLVGVVVVTAVVSFVWTPHDPSAVATGNPFAGPSASHPLGTDQFGRDLLSMMMVGARTTLFVGILAVGIAIAAGIPMGGFAVVGGTTTDETLMRTADVMYALPPVLMALVLAAVFGPSTAAAMAAIGIAYTPVVARVVRGSALTVMGREYALAARAYGRPRWFVFVRHALPNISSVLIVQTTVMFALAIVAEAGLSYLGIGSPPGTPSWGRMLRESQTYLQIAPQLAILPGVAIAVAVLGFNLLGDGLRDRLDPRLGDRRSVQAGGGGA